MSADLLALALAGCSPAPSWSGCRRLAGLPSGAPAPPRTPYRDPAVHDTPPPRVTTPLTDEQQLELEKGLQNARQQQESQAGAMKDAHTARPEAPNERQSWRRRRAVIKASRGQVRRIPTSHTKMLQRDTNA